MAGKKYLKLHAVAGSVGRIYSIIPTKVTKWLQLKLLANILGINWLPTKGLKLINRQ